MITSARGQVALVAAAVVWLAGCGPQIPVGYDDAVSKSPDVRATATVGAGDELHVQVYGEKELTGDYRVSPLGRVDVPLVGEVAVEGLTVGQISRLLDARFRDGLLREPHITVQLKSLNSKKVFVLGQVKKPGRFTFTAGMSVIEAITLAGGFSQLAEKNYTIVTRSAADGDQRVPVPVEKIMQGLASNFFLQPGDIVFVPQTVL